jgi:DNA-directed RNA polymerase sigma subunit (sigma70/sigma32)
MNKTFTNAAVQKIIKEYHALFQQYRHLFNEKDQQIIDYMWGPNGRKSTLQETGTTFQVTRERIRQREARVLKRLTEIKNKKVRNKNIKK